MNLATHSSLRYKIAIACFGGITCFFVLLVSYAVYVHFNYGGFPHATFLPSTRWGITQFERDAGWEPVYAAPGAGWDGQFYFRQSTDPFLQTDAVKCSDNVSYRYQRNGIPLVAWLVAKSIGMYPTNGWVFQAAQFVVIGLGFGCMLFWLMLHRLNWAYSVAWLCCGGWFALFHGLPDAGADAIFIVSCLCMMRQHLIAYAVSTSLLLLTREGYVAFAAPVFFLSIVNWIPWKGYSRLNIALATAVPGFIVVCWSCFVAFKTGTRPLSGAGQVPFGYLVDWPFHAYFRAMVIQFPTSHWRELLLRTLCILTIFSVLLLLLMRVKTWRYSLAFLPYVILISMTGYTIWENETGYPKATSAILIVAIFSLHELKSRTLVALLVLHLFFGLQMIHHYNVKYQGYMHPEIFAAESRMLQQNGVPPPVDPNAPKNELFRAMGYSISAKKIVTDLKPYSGLFQRFHRDPFLMEVTLTNETQTAWQAQQHGTPGSFAVSYQVLSDGKIVQFNNIFIDCDIAPGESYRNVIAIPCGHGFEQHQLILGLFQAPSQLFLEEQGGHPIRSTLKSIE